MFEISIRKRLGEFELAGEDQCFGGFQAVAIAIEEQGLAHGFAVGLLGAGGDEGVGVLGGVEGGLDISGGIGDVIDIFLIDFVCWRKDGVGVVDNIAGESG